AHIAETALPVTLVELAQCGIYFVLAFAENERWLWGDYQRWVPRRAVDSNLSVLVDKYQTHSILLDVVEKACWNAHVRCCSEVDLNVESSGEHPSDKVSKRASVARVSLALD